MTLPTNDPFALSQLFHLNSEPWLNDEAYHSAPYVQQVRTYPDAPRTNLPAGDALATARLAARRRSVRRFAVEPLPLLRLATLLHAAYGTIGPDLMEGSGRFLRRTVPSAGGLYPLELYLLVHRVEGMERGIYHYDTVGQGLEHLGRSDWRTAAPALFYTWPFVEEAAAILCFGADFGRCQKKYGPRGYRYILLEAGHAAQNLCLAAEEEGLSTLCMGGFRDADLNTFLGLDHPLEGIVYTVGIGRAASGNFP